MSSLGDTLENTIQVYDLSGNLILHYVARDHGVVIRNSALRRADFRNQSLEGAFLEDCDLTEADFSNADLYGAYLAFSVLDRANLTRASLRGANLNYCRFRNAVLAYCDLSSDNMGGMTHVQHADLRGADLRHADLKSVDMSGAEFDRTTLFPIGFDPLVHKMVQVSLAANES